MSNVNIDPTTVATIWHSMQTICKEMRHVVKRTAQNYLIGELQDLSVGIWGADGSTIAVPVGLANQHLGTTFAVTVPTILGLPSWIRSTRY